MRGNRNNAGRIEVLQRLCLEHCSTEPLVILGTITGGYKTTQSSKELLGLRGLMADIKLGYVV